MGEWLGNLAPWDVFSTWTFSRPVWVWGAMHWGRRHLKDLEKAAGQPVYAFFGVEQGSRGRLLHVQALVGNVGHLKTKCPNYLLPGQWARGCCMLHSWPCGYARVFPYDPQLGARYYVSKYVTKRLAEWELWGFPAAPQMSLTVRLRGGA